MIVTFAEDFSDTVELDSQLTGIPESGVYLNRGVHPLVTVKNVLDVSPIAELTFTAWNASVTYSKFEDYPKKSNIVSYNSKVYESIANTNLNNFPTDTDYWLETNLNSVRLKHQIYSSRDNMISALQLQRKLIENQYLYHVSDTLVTLDNDYSGWAFEPKGSDYVKIRINQIALQANTSSAVSLYVVNQGSLITTLTLNPQDGKLVFEDVDYTIYGKGAFYFVIDSQDVYSDAVYNDPLKYNGFVCYPVTGSGDTAAGATYSKLFEGNGFGFNISAHLDSDIYVDNNIKDLAQLWRTQFEYDVLQLMMYNPNSRRHGDQRIMPRDDIRMEVMDNQHYTVVAKYKRDIKMAREAIDRTFDRFIKAKSGLKARRRVL